MDIQKLLTRGCLLYISGMIVIFILIIGTLTFMDQCKSCEHDKEIQNYEESRDYKTPCENHDFTRAYKAIDLLKEDAQRQRFDPTAQSNYTSKYEEALKYVVFQEALYVLEENGDKGLPRIVGIVKEHDAYWLYEELIDTYQTLGDNNMVEQLTEVQNR